MRKLGLEQSFFTTFEGGRKRREERKRERGD
jgi:hypothetical protein